MSLDQPQTSTTWTASGRLGAVAAVVIGAVGVGTAAALSPATVASGPPMCPFLLMTGLPCPGCGLTRSWVAFMHGDFGSAFAFNLVGPLLISVTILTVVVAAVSLIRRRSGPIDRLRGVVIGPVGLALAIGWIGYGVFRAVDAGQSWGVFPLIT